MAGKQRNEGEGNKTAARDYNKRTEAFVRSGRVEGAAQDAKQAVEGRERGELKRAEQAGRARSKGEDPQLQKKK